MTSETQRDDTIVLMRQLAEQREEVKWLRDQVVSLCCLSVIELQALADSLHFTEDGSGCVSDAHVRVKRKVDNLLAAEAKEAAEAEED